jgi:sterol desaturase/sphingolipid hydroxylase (fatty acid hydroxylase superfamily)
MITTPLLFPRRTNPTRRRLVVGAASAAVSLIVVVRSIADAPQLLVGLGLAGLIAGSLELLVPLHGTRRSGRAWATDLTHAVGNRVLILPMVAVLTALLGPTLHGLTPEAVRDAFHALPWAGRAVMLLIVTDFANYWAHRALHQCGPLWRLHRVHHSTARLDWLATARGHPLDQMLNLTIVVLPAIVLEAATEGTALIMLLFIYPFVVHADARVRLPFVDRVFVTPTFHHWHHADHSAAHNRNLGSVLAVWDRLFGTAVDARGFPERYGIGDDALDANSYLGHLASPFRRTTAKQETLDRPC